jgi:hypothetical protein
MCGLIDDPADGKAPWKGRMNGGGGGQGQLGAIAASLFRTGDWDCHRLACRGMPRRGIHARYPAREPHMLTEVLIRCWSIGNHT